MEFVHWVDRPVLRQPLFVMAFEGWNDAGDAASQAVDYFAQEWNARRCATIDPEDFYDFTVTRPTVRPTTGGGRLLEWPHVEVLAATVPAGAHDVLLLRGVEPQLRWRTFCDAVVSIVEAMRIEMVVVLGALLADVPHTRPVRISGTSTDQDLSRRAGFAASSYEGPTGIVGVLFDALRQAELPAASLWAAVPHYVHQVPSPKAALALVERSADLIGAPVNPAALRQAAAEYERQVSERVADDEDAAAYVAQLEDAEDLEGGGPGANQGPTTLPDPTDQTDQTDQMDQAGQTGSLPPGSADSLAAEVERFLRDHRRRG